MLRHLMRGGRAVGALLQGLQAHAALLAQLLRRRELRGQGLDLLALEADLPLRLRASPLLYTRRGCRRFKSKTSRPECVNILRAPQSCLKRVSERPKVCYTLLKGPQSVSNTPGGRDV